MIEETGSDHVKNNAVEGQMEVLISKTKFLTDQFIKMFDPAPTVKYRKRLMSNTYNIEAGH